MIINEINAHYQDLEYVVSVKMAEIAKGMYTIGIYIDGEKFTDKDLKFLFDMEQKVKSENTELDLHFGYYLKQLCSIEDFNEYSQNVKREELGWI